jgi:hypothetical protein
MTPSSVSSPDEAPADQLEVAARLLEEANDWARVTLATPREFAQQPRFGCDGGDHRRTARHKIEVHPRPPSYALSGVVLC